MKKYGFIYIWKDKKRNMYYIGCHWGTETDGYICSSIRMRKAHKRRPHDFKRKIIEIVKDRTKLLDTEFKWLSLIKEEEIGKKYYNLHKNKKGHWTHNPSSLKTIGEKISETQTGRKLPEEWKINIGNSLRGKKGRVWTDEQRENIRKKQTGRKQPPEQIAKRAMSHLGMQRPIVKCPHCDKIGGVNAMKIWHFDRCKNFNFKVG